MTQPLLHRRALLAAAGLALPSLALPSLARARTGAGTEPIRFKGPNDQTVDAERGSFEVPEDRRDPASRRIKLSYVRFRSTAARPGPPIVYLAGGPGGSGSRTASGPRFPIFMALREVADVIAFDQRGTGESTALPDLPTPPVPPPAPVFTRDGLTTYFRKAFQDAWADWTAAGVAMRGYNTVENADDIDALRRHLGVEQIDLWGISYGTHLALSVLKRHGGRVRRVALASLEGQDQTVKRPAHLDAYFDRVDRLIDAAPEVRAAVPDLPALMRRVHARYEAEPLRLNLSVDGAPTEVRIGGFGVQQLASTMVANPWVLAMIPGLYLALEAGNLAPVTPVLQRLTGLLGVSGMPEATDLASGISAARLAMVEQEARTAVLGDALNYPMPHLLGAVPDVDLGDDFRAPIRIDQPALLVAGTLDGRTPLEEQAEVEQQFRRASRVVVENAGHNVFEAHPEVQDLLVRFFRGEESLDRRLQLPPPTFRLG
ncbi:alpha/beta fold hydrolase [Caulobacter mirabilis]|uniref:Alpha/beta hydrolase n=1 Tax=Caulobacter mirabilis TaxID=69666 RepID=A0A2D2B3V6_9CAUL|nr:alpha/beta fold hydrolase [Caulobacter mirabilis]ATQ44896.1 alpha/beta hydrolase [Caulobacter mirabilis]